MNSAPGLHARHAFEREIKYTTTKYIEIVYLYSPPTRDGTIRDGISVTVDHVTRDQYFREWNEHSKSSLAL